MTAEDAPAPPLTAACLAAYDEYIAASRAFLHGATPQTFGRRAAAVTALRAARAAWIVSDEPADMFLGLRRDPATGRPLLAPATWRRARLIGLAVIAGVALAMVARCA